jgi:hypothetical protein
MQLRLSFTTALDVELSMNRQRIVVGIRFKLLANDSFLGLETDLLSVLKHRSIRHLRGLLRPVSDFHNRRVTGLLLKESVG